jgi:hypothetical protein
MHSKVITIDQIGYQVHFVFFRYFDKVAYVLQLIHFRLKASLDGEGDSRKGLVILWQRARFLLVDFKLDTIVQQLR